MKNAKKLSRLFAVIAALLILATILGYVSFHKAPPVIGISLEKAESSTQLLMEAICRGDYATAGEIFYGKPELQWDRDGATQLGDQLWQAYSSTMSWEFSGDCYTTGSGIFRDVTVKVLDIPALGPKIQQRFELLMEPHLTDARYDSEAFDENGVLRQDFAAEMLRQAAEQILRETPAFVTHQISLQLVFHEGQWWVMPEDSVVDLVAGVLS